MAITELQVQPQPPGLLSQPPCFSRTLSPASNNHLRTFCVFCLLFLPLLEEKFHTENVVISSKAPSECQAEGKLNRTKVELTFWAQCLADAKHRKTVAITIISLTVKKQRN